MKINKFVVEILKQISKLRKKLLLADNHLAIAIVLKTS